MLTIPTIITTMKSETIDGRDFARLCQFLTLEQISSINYFLEKGAKHEIKPFTEEAVLTQLKRDVAFGFEKALNQKGISASCMESTVKMWNTILENKVEAEYAQYGLPLFKATALFYGFPNEIGEDEGTELKYAGHDNEH